jgi:hypothetical protein
VTIEDSALSLNRMTDRPSGVATVVRPPKA